MITTIFRSRLNAEHEADYEKAAARIEALARTVPGFVSIKTFAVEDGERVSIVEFESWETMHAWRANTEHLEAQQAGRERFYSEFSITSFEHQ
mgnify:CR=1 FL=1|jgi:heme-degrading monooxygenase HmoA